MHIVDHAGQPRGAVTAGVLERRSTQRSIRVLACICRIMEMCGMERPAGKLRPYRSHLHRHNAGVHLLHAHNVEFTPNNMARIRLVLSAVLVACLLAHATAAPAKKPPPAKGKKPPPKAAKKPPPSPKGKKSPPPPMFPPPPPPVSASTGYPQKIGSISDASFKGMAYTAISGSGTVSLRWRG